MRAKVKKVYYCEFCRKHYLSAGSMSRYEKYCKHNPKNAHKCFEFCRHLERTNEVGFTEDGEPYARKIYFTCLKTKRSLYSFHLEKKESLFPYSHFTKGLTRMPLECDKFEEMDIDENSGSYIKN